VNLIRHQVKEELQQRAEQAAHTKGEKWTQKALEKLKAYRDEHGTGAAAEHYGMTAARIRALLPGKPTKKPSPWPGLGR
jgi:hypothetical protein